MTSMRVSTVRLRAAPSAGTKGRPRDLRGARRAQRLLRAARRVSGLALGVCIASPGWAQSVTVPGSQVGLTYAPFHEGLYAIDTFNVQRLAGPNQPRVGDNLPILLWASPYKLFGGRIEPLIIVPTFFESTDNPAGLPNRNPVWNVGTFLGSILAWDLGNHVGVSYVGGIFLDTLNAGRGSTFVGQFTAAGRPVGAYTLNQLATNVVLNEVVLNYTGPEWSLVAALTHNLAVDPVARFGGAVGSAIGPLTVADGLNLDLTATRQFGKWEVGPIAYGTTTLPVSRRDVALGTNGFKPSGRFAVGGLVGYDFGPFTVQAYVARDVATRAVDALGRPAYETDGWFRVVVPLARSPASYGGPATVER